MASLIEDGVLTFETTARSLLGGNLPLIDDRVTIADLLANRSGIGDYLDEDAGGDILDYAMTLPVHQLDDAERYLPMLEGHPQKFAPGTDFAYCNSGFVVLALLAERASGVSFYDLVRQRVCERAGLTHTAFLRNDELGGEVAVGYLGKDGLRTNVLHLPVVGSGDGGLYSTTADLAALWKAVLAGRVVPDPVVADMLTPRNSTESGSRYGLGFWLGAQDGEALLVGSDAGVSFRSVHDRRTDVTWTVVSNTSEGPWPVAKALAEELGT